MYYPFYYRAPTYEECMELCMEKGWPHDACYEACHSFPKQHPVHTSYPHTSPTVPNSIIQAAPYSSTNQQLQCFLACIQNGGMPNYCYNYCSWGNPYHMQTVHSSAERCYQQCRNSGGTHEHCVRSCEDVDKLLLYR
ncbi:hypothetical protein DJ50_1104 [Bacillus cereus ATCC 10876]|nr:hypothetical protein DJ50_1104 [Bacillus cereus ATCC 10876]SUV13440.1 Uncharacterised protein [Bacillus cereus]